MTNLIRGLDATDLPPMAVRRVAGLVASCACHVSTIAALLWFAFKGLPQAIQAVKPVVIVVGADARVDEPVTPGDLGIHVDAQSGRVPLPGFAFDYQKVASHAALLFPFVTGRLSLEALASQVDSVRRGGLEDPLRPTASHRGRPLMITDARLQTLVDATWSRRDRWRAFPPIASAAEEFDPNVGRLPDLLRGYEQQNGLQPYVDGKIRDLRLWVELGLAADHADFIDFIGGFAVAHPATRARTDLLFLLDKIAQASMDALVTLLDTIPPDDLQWTKNANSKAYEAILTIQRYYLLQLERRDLTSRRALIDYYTTARLSILTNIVETTPDQYRANDARYLVGEIYWRQGRAGDARRWWAALETRDQRDEYVNEYADIAAELTGSADAPLDSLVVNRILNAERGRWLSFSATRLRQFGYHFDTF